MLISTCAALLQTQGAHAVLDGPEHAARRAREAKAHRQQQQIEQVRVVVRVTRCRRLLNGVLTGLLGPARHARVSEYTRVGVVAQVS